MVEHSSDERQESGSIYVKFKFNFGVSFVPLIIIQLHSDCKVVTVTRVYSLRSVGHNHIGAGSASILGA